jgi:hypothetical protein
VNNRLRNLLIGAAVMIAGVVGLLLPVSVWNGSSTVGCGNAIVAEKPAPSTTNLGHISVDVPEQAISHPDYAAQCDSAISSRRHWGIPLVIVGTAGLLLGIFYRPRRKTT